jgi:hypothetical protein
MELRSIAGRRATITLVADIKGIDFGLEKLWDVAASGIGALLLPWQMKRVARAEITVEKMKR